MVIEHIGIQVPDPGAAAEWYVAHLGFTIKRHANDPHPVRFLLDSSGTTMIEMYRNPAVDVPEYAEMDPLHLHIALCCDDVDGLCDELVSAGAEVVGNTTTTPAGDRLAMLRDPWGVPFQLCNRAEAMIDEYPKS